MSYADQIKEEVWTLCGLHDTIREVTACVEWLARRSLIANSRTCEFCGQLMTLVRFDRSQDQRRWSCRRPCNKRVSIRVGSFFFKSNMPLWTIVKLMFIWAVDLQQNYTRVELGISNKTIVDWFNFCREECKSFVENNDEIGGLDANGQPIVVEIDESKYFHRKYHVGHYREGHWVFGGVERVSGKCFLVEVHNRSAATLQAEILRHILPGTHIISDGWAAYANIPAINNGIYMHSVIIHERNFVDPTDPEIHTQNIENLWMRAKKKLKRQCGTTRELFRSYLHEFIFRNSIPDIEFAFGCFLARVSANYQF